MVGWDSAYIGDELVDLLNSVLFVIDEIDLFKASIILFVDHFLVGVQNFKSLFSIGAVSGFQRDVLQTSELGQRRLEEII